MKSVKIYKKGSMIIADTILINLFPRLNDSTEWNIEKRPRTKDAVKIKEYLWLAIVIFRSTIAMIIEIMEIDRFEIGILSYLIRRWHF